jgi:hypothetical protein
MDNFLIRFLTELPAWLGMTLGSLFFVLIAASLAVAMSLVKAPAWQNAFKGMFPPLCAPLMIAFVFFAVILANSEWRDFEDAHRQVHREVNALQRMMTQLDHSDIGRDVLRQYAQSASDQEWPLLADGLASTDTEAKLAGLRAWVMAPDVPFASPAAASFFQDAVKEVGAAREQRLTLARVDIPSISWMALLISAASILLAVAMVHAHNPRAAVTLNILYGAVIGTIVTLLILLDHPYTGSLSVSPDDFQTFLTRF